MEEISISENKKHPNVIGTILRNHFGLINRKKGVHNQRNKLIKGKLICCLNVNLNIFISILI